MDTGQTWTAGKPLTLAIAVEGAGGRLRLFSKETSGLNGDWKEITPVGAAAERLAFNFGPNAIGINCQAGGDNDELLVDYVGLIQNTDFLGMK